MPKARERSESARGARTRDTISGLPRPWGEFLGIALLAIGVLMVGGLCSYQFGAGYLMGPVGHLAASALYATLGMGAYLLVLGVLGLGVKALLGETMEIHAGEGLGFAGATIAGCVLLHVTFPEYRTHGLTAGGLTGEVLGEVGLGLFERAGTYLIALALLAVGLFASTPLSVAHLVIGAKLVARGTVAVGVYLWGGLVGLYDALRGRPGEDAEETEEEYDEEEDELDEDAEAEDEEEEEPAPPPKRRSRKAAAPAEPAAPAPAPAPALPAAPVAEPRKNRKLPRAPEDMPEIVVAGPARPEEAVKPEPKKKAKPEPAESESEGEPEAAANSSAPKRRRKAPAPEIVEEEDEEPVAEERESVEESAPVSRSGKKPPPRLAEIMPPANVAPAPAPVQLPLTDAKPAPERTPAIPGIVRLTPGPFLLPPSKLFELPEQAVTEVDKGFVLEQAERIEHALSTFKVTGKVTKIHPGPVITRYEFKPDPGMKLSRIESLENDLAMALEAISIRIVAPIPGKAAVGIEVPNKVRETVFDQGDPRQRGLRQRAHFKLPMALGKNIAGKPIASTSRRRRTCSSPARPAPASRSASTR